VGLEWGPLSLMNTTEELNERKSSASSLEKYSYGHRGSAAPTTRHPFNRKMLALTSPTSGSCSVGTVHSRPKATEVLVAVVVVIIIIIIISSSSYITQLHQCMHCSAATRRLNIALFAI
jgi:hypothetical protein